MGRGQNPVLPGSQDRHGCQKEDTDAAYRGENQSDCQKEQHYSWGENSF